MNFHAFIVFGQLKMLGYAVGAKSLIVMKLVKSLKYNLIYKAALNSFIHSVENWSNMLRK